MGGCTTVEDKKPGGVGALYGVGPVSDVDATGPEDSSISTRRGAAGSRTAAGGGGIKASADVGPVALIASIRTVSPRQRSYSARYRSSSEIGSTSVTVICASALPHSSTG